MVVRWKTLFNLFNRFKETPILTNKQIVELVELSRKIRPWAKWYKKDMEFDELRDTLNSLSHHIDRKEAWYKDLYEIFSNLCRAKNGELTKLRAYYLRGKAIRKKQHSEILRLRSQVEKLNARGMGTTGTKNA